MALTESVAFPWCVVEEEGGDCREVLVEPGGERVIGGHNGEARDSNGCKL